MSNSGSSASHQRLETSSGDSKISYVWRHNVATELQKLVQATAQYPIICIDTEFPGSLPRPPTSVYAPQKPDDPRGFLHMQYNISVLKLVQLGVSVCNERGEKPDKHVWQFNFHFDMKLDKKQSYGIRMLKDAGVDFTRHRKSGINANRFFDEFKRSGLIGTSNIRWICFHGLYDIGYIMKYIHPESAQCTFKQYVQLMQQTFPNIDDIKEVTLRRNDFSNDLGNESMALRLGCSRVGNAHQAGSDSALLCDVYCVLLKHYSPIEHNNRVHGFGRMAYENLSIGEISDGVQALSVDD